MKQSGNFPAPWLRRAATRRMFWTDGRSGFYPLPVCRRKAELLELTGAWAEAEAIYGQCLEWLAGGPKQRLAAEVSLSLGNLLRKRGMMERSFHLLEQSLALLESIGDEQGQARALGYLGLAHAAISALGPAVDCYQRSIEIARRLNDRRNLLPALGNLANIHIQQGRYEQASRNLEECRRIAEAAGDLQKLAGVWGNLGSLNLCQGRFPRAERCYRRQMDLASRIGDKYNHCYAIGNLGIIHQRHNYGQARDCYLQQLSIATELNLVQGIMDALGNLGPISYFSGEYQSSLDWSRRQLELAQRTGNQEAASQALGNMGSVCKELSKLDEAAGYLEQAVAIDRQLGLRNFLCSHLAFLADLRYRQGALADAAALNGEVLKMAAEPGLEAELYSARVLEAKLDYTADQDRGRAVLQRLWRDGLGDDEAALWHYEMYRMTGSDEQRIRALGQYRSLYRRQPKAQHRDRITEMEASGGT